jgi:predicted MFS family arabinose efflux permease
MLLGKEIPPERWVYTVVLLVGSLGPVSAGHLGESIRSERLLVVIFALTGGLLSILGKLSGELLLLASMGFGILLFAVIPLQQNVVGRYTAEGKLGAGYGVIFFVSHGVGGAGATLTGWLATNGTYAFVFSALAVFAFGSLLTVVFIEWIAKR